MRSAYILPNLCTSASLGCGVIAIISVLQGNLTIATWLILLSVVLDSLDGKVARLTRTQSTFGVNYDSLSDIVAFGVAPAILIFSYLTAAGVRDEFAASVVVLYVISGALRLARFNVLAVHRPQTSFVGLPIPAAAGVLVTSFAVFQRLSPIWTLKVLPMILVGVAYLMISRIKYPSGKTVHLDPIEFILISLTGAIAFLLFYPIKELLLFAIFWSYLLYGIAQHIVLFINSLHRQPVEEIAESELTEEEVEEETKF